MARSGTAHESGEALAYRVYGKGFDRDRQFTGAGDGDPNDAWQGGSAGARLDWQAGERDALTFDAGYLHGRSGREDSRPQVGDPFVLTNVEDEVTDAGHLLVRWTHATDENSNWVLQAFRDRIERESTGISVAFRLDTFDLDFQHESRSGERQTVIWGLGYRYIDISLQDSAVDDGFILSWDPRDRQLPLFSGFVQDQIELADKRLHVTLGAKVEHNDFTGLEVQPTGRLLWTPTERQAAWVAVSRAVRTPNLSDSQARSTALQSVPGTGPYPALTPNPDFESEEVVAYELGYRAQVTDRLYVDNALFWNDYDDLTVSVRTPSLDPASPPSLATIQRQNRMAGATYGVEVAATWQATDRWRLYAACTLLKMRLRADPSLPAGTRLGAEAAEGRSPQQQVYLRASWSLPGDVELDLTGRFIDGLDGFNTGTPTADVPNVIDSYVAFDARLAWKPRHNLEIALVGQNLFDERHPESGTSTSIRAPLVDIERSIHSRLTVEW